MSPTLNDVAFWSGHWATTGDLIPEDVARKIASYWQTSGSECMLAAFAKGLYVEGQAIRDDITAAIQYAKMAQFHDTIHELYALKDWVLHNL
jgi:hypothetical protein